MIPISYDMSHKPIPIDHSFLGLGMGPLLDFAIMINPAIVVTALLMSASIFACFSGAALFAPNGQYLYLGGSLMSAMSALFWMGLVNIFFRSQIVFQVRKQFCYLKTLISWHSVN